MTIRRPWLAVVGAACASFAAAAPARAAPATAALETTAGADAADCPKAAALAATVNEGLGRTALTPASGDAAADGKPVRVLVHFERATKGFAATVNVGGGRGGTRKLSDAGPKCSTLGNAVGVLLVLLLDADADALGDAAGSATTTERASAGSGPVAQATTAGLAVAGGVAEGLVGGWSPTIGLGGTIAHDRWSVRLGGVWLPDKVTDYGPGRVGVGLTYARLALCGSTRAEQSGVTMALCAQQQVGWMRGHGYDYPGSNNGVDLLWLAAGASIVANGSFERAFGWEAEAGVVRLLRQHRFFVGDVGTAFESDPWAFTMTLAFTTRLW